MNRESLYLELGGIDDDLILEAADARGAGKRWINFVRVLSAAACLCLICASAFVVLRRDVVHFNEADAPIASKVHIPMDEHTTVLSLTEAEMLAYYGLAQFPDTLAGLRRVELAPYYLYQNAEDVIYDTNVLRYRTDDDGQSLSITLAKEDTLLPAQTESLQRSRLDGTVLTLAVANGASTPVYWAELDCGEVSLRIVAHGMDEASFTDALRAIIRSQS